MKYFIYDQKEGFEEFESEFECIKRLDEKKKSVLGDDSGVEVLWGVILAEFDNKTKKKERPKPLKEISDGEEVWYMHGNKPESIIFNSKNPYHSFLKESCDFYSDEKECRESTKVH